MLWWLKQFRHWKNEDETGGIEIQEKIKNIFNLGRQ